MANVRILKAHEAPPKLAPWGVLLFPCRRQGSAPRLVAVVSLIEPFADVVGNHTSQDGENKRQNTHQAHPLLLPYVGAATHTV